MLVPLQFWRIYKTEEINTSFSLSLALGHMALHCPLEFINSVPRVSWASRSVRSRAIPQQCFTQPADTEGRALKAMSMVIRCIYQKTTRGEICFLSHQTQEVTVHMSNALNARQWVTSGWMDTPVWRAAVIYSVCGEILVFLRQKYDMIASAAFSNTPGSLPLCPH